MHLFFLCPFAKAAWYCHPWFIKTEPIAQHKDSVPQMIQALLNSHHPQISITSLYTFLWCFWKSRNEVRFGRKLHSLSQDYAEAEAIMQSTNLEVTASTQTVDAIRLID